MKREFEYSCGGLAARDGVGGADPSASLLAPIVAGARARGMADALAMLGLAAIFLGEDGLVLFVNDLARALMGEHLWLAGDRLRVRNETSDRALRRLIAAAPDGGPSSMILREEAGRPALRLRVASPAWLRGAPFQLLKAVVILEASRGRPRQQTCRRPLPPAASVSPIRH